MQARRFAALRRLQNVFKAQRRRSFVTQCKRILQELDDLGFRLYIFRAIPVLQAFGTLIARQGRPDEVVGGRNMLQLRGKSAHTFEVAASNIQALGREVVFAFRYRVGDIQNLLFDIADLAINH